MRIKVIMPDTDRSIQTMKERQKMLQAYVSEETVIAVDKIKCGAAAIDCNVDEFISGKEVIKEAIKAEKEAFDAVVIYCFSDIGINAIRECINIPVIGPGETTLAVANILFNRFAVLTTTSENCHRTYRRLMGNPICREKLVAVSPIAIPLNQLHDCPERTVEVMTAICADLVENNMIDGIVLGCMGLALYGQKVEENLGITVLDPSKISIGFAEMFARNHIRHNNLSYPQYKGIADLEVL